MEERIKLTNGYRWFRWVFVFIGSFAIIGLLSGDYLVNNSIGLVICILLFYLFNKSRRIFFDSRNIYIVHGNHEKEIPLRTVKSLKRSRGKVNSQRFWIVAYEGDGAQEKKFRFFSNPFDSTIKQFKQAIKEHNAGVVIWDHPFFNH
ncbi:MAG: hypothetical protein H6551_01665 [Chitinophagales bacterium]|nr:hypothetical protein [Chitinophagaceae bacterium]MCB9063832.1 hypothetical protein [Chitinophagales bacterium]